MIEARPSTIQHNYELERFNRAVETPESGIAFYEVQKRLNKTMIFQWVAILGLMVALIFLSIARSEAMDKAEAMQAAVAEHEAREAEQAIVTEKIRVSAKAAAEQIKLHEDNVAELQGILENQMKDIDTLFAERNALRAEVETMREQIGENPYKDIKMTKDERAPPL